jgi:hypothetical protein
MMFPYKCFPVSYKHETVQASFVVLMVCNISLESWCEDILWTLSISWDTVYDYKVSEASSLSNEKD